MDTEKTITPAYCQDAFKIEYFLSSLKTGEPSQNEHTGRDASWQQRGVRATACYNRSEAAFTANDLQRWGYSKGGLTIMIRETNIHCHKGLNRRRRKENEKLLFSDRTWKLHDANILIFSLPYDNRRRFSKDRRLLRLERDFGSAVNVAAEVSR